MCSLPIMADVVCLLGSSGVPADGFRFFFYGRWADGKLCWSAQIPALEPRRRPQRVLGVLCLEAGTEPTAPLGCKVVAV